MAEAPVTVAASGDPVDVAAIIEPPDTLALTGPLAALAALLTPVTEGDNVMSVPDGPDVPVAKMPLTDPDSGGDVNVLVPEGPTVAVGEIGITDPELIGKVSDGVVAVLSVTGIVTSVSEIGESVGETPAGVVPDIVIGPFISVEITGGGVAIVETWPSVNVVVIGSGTTGVTIGSSVVIEMIGGDAAIVVGWPS